MLRRRNRPVHDVYTFDDLEINRITHQVNRGGRFIELSPKEYALLEFLLRNPGRPVSRATIIEQVWRMHSDSITNVVDVYVNYLRRKIDAGSERPPSYARFAEWVIKSGVNIFQSRCADRLRRQLVTDEREAFAVGRPGRHVDGALAAKQTGNNSDLAILQ